MSNAMAPTDSYPPGWPRCPCGKAVMDGHLTCGEASCSESAARAAAHSRPGTAGADLVESLAQWLHDETGHPDSYPDYTWPETDRDDGQREGAFVKIVPLHAQANFRDIARRLVARFALSDPAVSPQEAVVGDLSDAPKDGSEQSFEVTLRLRGYWDAELSNWVLSRPHRMEFVPSPARYLGPTVSRADRVGAKARAGTGRTLAQQSIEQGIIEDAAERARRGGSRTLAEHALDQDAKELAAKRHGRRATAVDPYRRCDSHQVDAACECTACGAIEGEACRAPRAALLRP